jgi:hypothetical protein
MNIYFMQKGFQDYGKKNGKYGNNNFGNLKWSKKKPSYHKSSKYNKLMGGYDGGHDSGYESSHDDGHDIEQNKGYGGEHEAAYGGGLEEYSGGHQSGNEGGYDQGYGQGSGGQYVMAYDDGGYGDGGDILGYGTVLQEYWI